MSNTTFGFQLFQTNIFEFDLHAFVVDLQSDGSVGQSSAFGVVGELRSEFAVDEELEVVSAGNDADVVPLVWANVRQRERSGDGAGMWLSVFVDDRPRADMPGFVPWERDLQRQVHREKYLAIELDTRKAIRQRRN